MPTLTVYHGRKQMRTYRITKAKILIGRITEADLQLDNPIVSRRHAEVYLDGPSLLLRNLSKKNGTFMNGEKIEIPMRLMSGDTIEIGKFSLKFDMTLEERRRLIAQHQARQSQRVDQPTVDTLVGANPATTDPNITDSVNQHDATFFMAPEEMQKTLQAAREARQTHLEMITPRGPKNFPLDMESTTIGKDESCDIRIEAGWRAPKMSVTVYKRFDGVVILKGIKGRVAVNGNKKLRPEEKLNDEDLIEIEGIPFKFFSGLGK